LEPWAESEAQAVRIWSTTKDAFDLAEPVPLVNWPQLHPADKKYPQPGPYSPQGYRADQCLTEIKVELERLNP
jgi:hypothetical protein